MKSSETWLLVEARKEELRKLTNKSWNSQEWELGALGERVLMTVNNSIVSAGIMRRQMTAYEKSVAEMGDQVQQIIKLLGS
ncbi:MAG: hypothetical protein PHE50_05665 [Dehalococcoidales bacterium]|nr:hypothetical protein [Dehalococcoidales bacterium]